MARRPAEDRLVGTDVGTTNTKSAVFSVERTLCRDYMGFSPRCSKEPHLTSSL
jgi:hypothetical protein